MKTQNLLLSGVFALSLAAVGAQAQVLAGSDIGGLNVVGANAGDIMLGVRNATSSSDFAVDLGNFTAYENVAAGTYTVAGFNAAELTSVFANAFTTAGTQWTVFGGTGNNPTTQPTGTLWISSNSNLNKSNTGASLSNAFDTFLNTGLAVSSFGGTSNATVISSPKLFSMLSSSSGYGAYTGVESTTVGSTSLKLWELTPGTGAGTLLGTFNLSSSGLTFTSAMVAIPEPSTYAAILGVATLGFAALRRRKQAVVA